MILISIYFKLKINLKSGLHSNKIHFKMSPNVQFSAMSENIQKKNVQLQPTLSKYKINSAVKTSQGLPTQLLRRS